MALHGVRRRTVAALVMALVAGSVLSGAGVFVSVTRATDMDKGAFKSGCESGGHSYVENNDGSFQCNLKDGGTIKCQNTSSPCTYTAMMSIADTIRAVSAGNLQAAANPTPTPTKPVNRAGGIAIAPVVGAAQPQVPAGNRSGIYLNAWTCPAAVAGDQGQLTAACKVDLTINLEIYGPNLHQFPHGGISDSGMPAGLYRVREYVPSGYSIPSAFCGVAASEDQQPAQSPVVVYDGYYEFQLAQDQTIYCNWFNVPLQGANPTPTKPVNRITGVGVTKAQNQPAVPVGTPPA